MSSNEVNIDALVEAARHDLGLSEETPQQPQANEAIYTEEELASILEEFNNGTTTNNDSTEDNTESAEPVIEETILDEAVAQFPMPEVTAEEVFTPAEEVVEEPQEEEQPQGSSLLFDDSTTRFRGAPWYEIAQNQIVTVAGIGGIGSWAALLLARVHPMRMVLYDPDLVESVNMAGQLYGNGHIGLNKASALYTIIDQLSTYNSTNVMSERYTSESTATNIMICGFDNMEARKTFYESWKVRVHNSYYKGELLFIDGRMAAEELQVICITGNNKRLMDEYERDWLFSDAEAEHTICSYKQTSYCAAMIGSIITNLFVNFCTNLANPIIPRELPFITSYDASLMYFKTYGNN